MKDACRAKMNGSVRSVARGPWQGNPAYGGAVDQTHAGGMEGCLGAERDIQLSVNAFHIVGCGVPGETHRGGEIGYFQALGKEAESLHLPVVERHPARLGILKKAEQPAGDKGR